MKKVIVLHMVRKMELGGIQALIMDAYRNIDKNKVQFHFLVNSKGVYDDEIIKLGGKIHYMPHITETGPSRYKKNLNNFFKTHPEYKILHSHFVHFSGIIVKVAAKSKIPVIIAHSHNISTKTKGIKKIYKDLIKKNIKKYATDFFACSLDAAKYIFEEKYKSATIIKNGIEIEKYKYDSEKRKEIRQELNIDNDTTVIGHVGRVCKQKNHTFILKIFKEYLKLNPNSKLLLIGDGDLRENIENEIEVSDLSNKVLFFKEINACEYYNVMDYFLFPSIYEGLGITLIEAQANGLPSFTSTAVPLEANVTGKIHYLDLDKGSKYWANIIYETDKSRYVAYDEIQKSGYDIKDTARKLEEFYIKKVT